MGRVTGGILGGSEESLVGYWDRVERVTGRGWGVSGSTGQVGAGVLGGARGGCWSPLRRHWSGCGERAEVGLSGMGVSRESYWDAGGTGQGRGLGCWGGLGRHWEGSAGIGNIGEGSWGWWGMPLQLGVSGRGLGDAAVGGRLVGRGPEGARDAWEESGWVLRGAEGLRVLLWAEAGGVWWGRGWGQGWGGGAEDAMGSTGRLRMGWGAPQGLLSLCHPCLAALFRSLMLQQPRATLGLSCGYSRGFAGEMGADKRWWHQLECKPA